jgi:uncharacterized protein
MISCCSQISTTGHGTTGNQTPTTPATAFHPGDVAVPMLSELRNRRSEILELARARGASRVRVFGSVARGEATETSDIDFLVDLDEGRSLLDLGGLLMDLRELLGHDVDVATEAGLRSRVGSRVLADAVDL